MSSTPGIPQSDASYHITILRHGQSRGNLEARYQGQADYPLTGQGRDQSRALARRWQQENRKFQTVISSPLKRAWETAEIIASELGLPLEADPDWMERHNGNLTGLTRDEAAEHQPRPAFIPPFQPMGTTGESQWDLYLRAGQALKKLLHRPPGNYLVVSHGGILNLILYAILGIAPQANFQGPRFRFGNTAFATLIYQPNEHVWQIHGLNDQAHLAGITDPTGPDSPLA